MSGFTFAGRMMQLLPERALYWPDRQALLVADLHLEKASWYARHGQHLPPYDSIATLTRLAGVVARMPVDEIWALGDNFHDAGGAQRLDPAARSALNAIAQGRRIVWITGNHDVAARDGSAPDHHGIAGEVMVEALVDGIMLRHEAQADESAPEISGHFHPSITIDTRGRAIRRPCAVLGGNRLILPAFGSLTGTLDCRAPPIRKIVVTEPLALVPTRGGVRRFPIA